MSFTRCTTHGSAGFVESGRPKSRPAIRRAGVRLLAGFVALSLSPVAAQKSKPSGGRDAERQWTQTTAEQLASFLPKPVAALVDRMPWDDLDSNVISMHEGAWPRNIDPVYCPVFVSQRWSFNDTVRAQQYQQLKSSEGDAVSRAAELMKQQQAASDARMQKVTELAKRQADLAVKGRLDEADKLQKEIDRVSAEAAREAAKIKEIADKPYEERQKIASKGRALLLYLVANEEPPAHRQPAGTLQGFVLYRQLYTGPGLGVYFGPPGFRNAVPTDRPRRLEVRSILVHAMLRTTPENLKSDEAVALEMLGRIDLAGLSRLIGK